MIAAFNEICRTDTNVRLILTGGGNGKYMDELFAQIKLNPSINYMGFLSTAEYYETLISSDICCMTRNNSLFANAGFPYKLGEFLAAGKAIIATDVGDVSLYLVDHVNALVIAPESVESIKEALLICLENKIQIRQKLGIAAKETALAHFDGDKLSRKLLGFFKEI